MTTRAWWLALIFSLLSPGQGQAQSLVPKPPSPPLRQEYDRVYFAESGVGYVGSSFALLRTADAGATWTPLIETFKDSSPDILELFFVDDATVFVFGAGGFLRTADGGRSFERLSIRVPAIDAPDRANEVREGFFFLTRDLGWAIARGQFLATSDGGRSWGHRRLRVEEPLKLWMFDAQRGIGIGGRQVVRTQDGGENWDVVPNSPRLEKLHCVSGGFCVGLLLGLPSAAFLSSDYGETWRQTETGFDRQKDRVVAFQAIGPGDAVIVGSHTPQRRQVFRNWDLRTPLPTDPPDEQFLPERGLLARWDGTTWQRREYPEVERFWAIHFVNATEAWASADYNGILHSTDGGHTWTFVPDYYRGLEAQRPKPTPFYKWPPPTFIKIPPGRE